jgi:8-oxo-dGTP pyrophosphatase MutT (NUDIX family)
MFVRQYRHNLRSHQLEFPGRKHERDRGTRGAARHELEEDTGYALADGT